MTYTAADLIKKYIELRDKLEQETAAFGEKMKPYQDAMEVINGQLLMLLNQQGGDNIKTPSGTAYKTELTSAKVVDREAFLDYVFENEADQFLTSAVAKDAVKEHVENYGVPPPGVDITKIIKLNIRRN